MTPFAELAANWVPKPTRSFHSGIRPLSAPVRAELRSAGVWQQGCPVSLAHLRVLTVTHWGFDKRAHTGQLVVNADAAAPLARVFRRLYELRFPIRHMLLADELMEGPQAAAPPGFDLYRNDLAFKRQDKVNLRIRRAALA